MLVVVSRFSLINTTAIQRIIKIVEQAGGRASTGTQRVLDVAPRALHERCGFIFGSRNEVERIE